MSPAAELAAAVHNNADWVSSVCRAHRIGWSFSPRAWRSASPTPQFYPEAITLRPNATATDVLPADSVKDSYATLDLTPYGFTVLFTAQWIYHPAPTPAPPPPASLPAPSPPTASPPLTCPPPASAPPASPLPVSPLAASPPPASPPPASPLAASPPPTSPLAASPLPSSEPLGPPPPAPGRSAPPPASAPRLVPAERVTSAAGLRAWKDYAFPPALLDDRSVSFMTISTRGGFVLNRTGNVLGLSNLFAADPADLPLIWSSAVAAADGHPLVGYEHADDLALAHAAGFRSLGPLRIWSRTPENDIGDVLGDGHA